MFDYRAKLSDKIRKQGDDGDTVLLIWDQGRGTHGEEAVRLAGVWAPERGDPGYKEAAAYLASTLREITAQAAAKSSRWPFHLFTEPSTAVEPTERRTLTRYVGVLRVAESGVSINDMMATFLAANPQWGSGQR